MGGGTTNFTSVNLAGTIQKKVQSTDDILKQIEATITDNQEDKFKQEELSQRILGRISQHETAFGDKNLPRQRLPKMDPMLLDRYNAARRNVLVLGAIKQAAGSKINTHRSGKSSVAPSAKDHLDGASSIPDELSTARDERDRGLNSTFTSFSGSRSGSPDRTARDGDITAEHSGLLGAEASQASISSRRMRHQMSGRSAASSFAGSVAASSSAGKLRHNNSSLSAGSGHTLRSEATNFSKYSHFRKTPRRGKSGKPKPGRVTTALAEYAQKDDWMSKTLLKHYLASVLQARWRGYTVRKRWAEQESRLALVAEEKAKQQAESLHQQRIQDLQQKLLTRQAKQQAQATAAAVAAAAADGQAAGESSSSSAAAVSTAAVVLGAGALRSVSGLPSNGQSKVKSTGGSAGMHVAGGRVPSAASAGKGKAAKISASDSNPAPGHADSDSDSGWSDIELEDVASIKFRAVTPPWQRVGEQCYMNQRLKRRTAAATAAATGQAQPEGWCLGEDFAWLGLAWDSSSEECETRLQELRHRRICRKPEAVQLSGPAAAAAAASGLLAPAADAADAAAASSRQDTVNPAEAVIPSQVVEELLLDRYNAKYARMGVLEKMPGRQRYRKLQRDKQAGLYGFATGASAAEEAPVLSAGASAVAVPGATATAAATSVEGAAAATMAPNANSTEAIETPVAAVVAPPVAPAAARADRPYAVKTPAGAAGSGAVPASLPPVKRAA